MTFREFLRELVEIYEGEITHSDLEESKFADVACKAAFRLEEQNPVKKAEELAEKARNKKSDLIGRVEQKGPYVNFFVSEKFLKNTLLRILEDREKFGSLGYKGSVIVEHTSANPDGPLHIGHIRNSIIGDIISRVFRKAGYDVKSEYYVNDMGKQIAVAVLGARKYGVDQNKKGDFAVSEVYVRINREGYEEGEVENLMVRYEKGNPETIKEFKKIVELSLSGIKKTLKRLNVSHDLFIWESEFLRNGYVDTAVEKLSSLKEFVRNDAVYLDLKDHGYEKEVYLTRSNGTTLYILRDIAHHMWKAENHDRIINVLGADHKLYAEMMTLILSMMGIKPPENIIFEFVTLPEGSMSTRKGEFISADELLERVEEKALELSRSDGIENQERMNIARAVATGAIRFDIARVSPEKPTVFNWQNALDFEKQTAPYLQYSYARARSILRKTGEEWSAHIPDIHPAERDLLLEMSKFSYNIEKVVNSLRPSIIASYALSLASAFNNFYRDVPVLKADEEVKPFRVGLVKAFTHVMGEILKLLGIETLERM